MLRTVQSRFCARRLSNLHKRVARNGRARARSCFASGTSSSFTRERFDTRDTTAVATAVTAGLLAMTLLVADSKANNVLCDDTTQCDSRKPPTNTTFQVSQHYILEKILGQGTYGIVMQARRKTDNQLVALKTMKRDMTDPEEFQREVSALQHLSRFNNGGHPGVCHLYELHQDDQNYYLAMELIQGGELLEHLIRNGPYSEAQAATFVRQYAEALCFIHGAGIVHADLKPENLMMSELNDDNKHQKLKIVDFGCAVFVDKQQNKIAGENLAGNSAESVTHKESGVKGTMAWVGGTTAYWPPELVVHEGAWPTPASDMWAAGCILYILLCGTHPFDKYGDATDEDIADMIRLVGQSPTEVMETLVFDERINGLSDSCVQLTRHLMHPDPAQRMTSSEFLRHPWVQGLTASWKTMADSHRKLEAFWQKRFRMEVLKKYGSSGSLSDKNLVDIFRSMDLNGDGVLQPEELQTVFHDLGMKKDVATKIFESVDLDGSGEIDLDEFKAIMRKAFDDGPDVRVYHRQLQFSSDLLRRFGSGADGKKAMSEDGLREIFHAIDLDGNGILDPHELRVVLRTAGEDDDTISQIVASVDLNHDGGVSWEEFCEIMRRRHEGCKGVEPAATAASH